MYTEKQVRKLIRKRLVELAMKAASMNLREQEEAAATEDPAEEQDEATRTQILKGLKLIWPDEDFSKAVPSSKAKLEAFTSAVQDVLRTSAEGNITALAKKVDAATDSMVGKD
jgi:hypothetical protein